jgi:predicted MPP superfamily phosphohydrolase
VSEKESELNKVDPSEVERLLKYGVYAFLDNDDENSEQNANNTDIKLEDILKNKGV